MKMDRIEERVEVGGGASASYDLKERVLTVKGEKGELKRVLYHPAIHITVEDGAIRFFAEHITLREKKRMYTFVAHAKNMVKGVTEGFTYKLKICSGHFPMSATVKDRSFEVKNFIGEKVPRVLPIKEGAEVTIDGEVVTVTGFDKEVVGQVAADIEQLTRRTGFDSRVFQDGIFITHKHEKKV